MKYHARQMIGEPRRTLADRIADAQRRADRMTADADHFEAAGFRAVAATRRKLARHHRDQVERLKAEQTNR